MKIYPYYGSMIKPFIKEQSQVSDKDVIHLQKCAMDVQACFDKSSGKSDELCKKMASTCKGG